MSKDAKQDSYVKVVETTTTGKEVTKYKLNGRLVKGAEVPEEVKNGLEGVEVGSAVDVKGQAVDLKTDAPSEGSDDDQLDENQIEDFDDAPVPSEEVLDSAKTDEETPETVGEVKGGDILEDDAPTRSDEKPGGPQEPQPTTVDDPNENETPPTPQVELDDEAKKAQKVADKGAAATAKAQPNTPAQLDKAAKAGARPDVKPVKNPETRREDELPGGPQEPVVADHALAIDSADDVDDASGLDVEEQDRQSRMRAGLENDEAGMGFPRKNGKTVDIFSGEPHTHVRYVAGVMVPLTKENHDTRSDLEIREKLVKLGKL